MHVPRCKVKNRSGYVECNGHKHKGIMVKFEAEEYSERSCIEPCS